MLARQSARTKVHSVNLSVWFQCRVVPAVLSTLTSETMRLCRNATVI